MAEEQNNTEEQESQVVAGPAPEQPDDTVYLFRGRRYGPGQQYSHSDLERDKQAVAERGLGAVTPGTRNRVARPTAQPVSQPQSPGEGVPSGLSDSRPVKATGAITGDQSEEDTDDSDDEDEGEESEYAGWTKDELEAEAKERGLDVERTDGRTDREPRVEDYIAALEADDEDEE